MPNVASKKLSILIAAVVLAVTGPRALAQPAPADSAGRSNPSQPYVLGADDVIEVQVLGRSDFKVRTRIGADGTIQLPYLGSFAAGSKTAKELGDAIAAALEKGGYFSHPIMSVEVASYASRYVTVLGSVGTPGIVPVDRPYHLSEILARVGGVRENGADYVVLRPQDGPERRLSVKALATGDASSDPIVSPGDKIFSPQAELFYISGQVKTPGAYPIAAGMTVRMAIARGGGVTELGTVKSPQVTHADGREDRPNLDATVRPGDVIVVRERLF